MAAAVGLSHNMFDAAVYLGVCDKILPGLVIAALSFGHLPAVFVPAGPMPSGLPTDETTSIRQLSAGGKVGRAEFLADRTRVVSGHVVYVRVRLRGRRIVKKKNPTH